jgi:hypothetical protein
VFGLSGSVAVRDVWGHADGGTASGAFAGSVGPADSLFVTLTPAHTSGARVKTVDVTGTVTVDPTSITHKNEQERSIRLSDEGSLPDLAVAQAKATKADDKEQEDLTPQWETAEVLDAVTSEGPFPQPTGGGVRVELRPCAAAPCAAVLSWDVPGNFVGTEGRVWYVNRRLAWVQASAPCSHEIPCGPPRFPAKKSRE